MVRRVGDLDVCTDIVEAESTPESTEHEEVSSTKVVDEEEEPDDGYQCLDDTEDAGGEERGVCAGDTNGFEDCGGVVVDGVDAGRILPEEEGTAKKESVADFAIVHECSEWLPESKTDGCMLMFECGIDCRDFFEHIDVVGVKFSDPAEVLEGFGALTTAHEPAWRFPDEEEADEHQASWDKLDSEWNEPLLS